MSELRHHKTGKRIGNAPLCVDDFGNLVFRCQYTGATVSVADAIILGAVIPQATCSYVCAPDALEAFRASKREFDAHEASCNTCGFFGRLPHPREASGLVRGQCRIGYVPTRAYRREDRDYGEFWVHPDDPMGMDCWRSRAEVQSMDAFCAAVRSSPAFTVEHAAKSLEAALAK